VHIGGDKPLRQADQTEGNIDRTPADNRKLFYSEGVRHILHERTYFAFITRCDRPKASRKLSPRILVQCLQITA
jgi:hypothetical protein